jgi:hypothetical protein
MAWIIFIAWAPQYMDDRNIDDFNIAWIKIVAVSILSAISMFFLSMTNAKR